MCAVATSFSKYLNINKNLNTEQILLGGLLGAILPDIDHNESWITQLLPIKFSRFLTHRGITHNVLVPILLLVSNLAIFRNDFLLGLAAGYLSHLTADKHYSSKYDHRNREVSKKKQEFLEKIYFYISWIAIGITVIYITLWGV